MEVPRHWRLKEQRYRLMGNVCQNCEAKIFPPRDICPYCNNNSSHPKEPEAPTPQQEEIATAIALTSLARQK